MDGSSLAWRTLGVAVVLCVVPALVGGVWGWLCAHPPRLVPPRDRHPDHWGAAYQEIILRTPDGLRLVAWYTPPRNGAVVLVAHGYANARLAEMHALFVRHGYGALSWDFRAHGESEGALCTVGYHEAVDVETALEFALAQPAVQRIGLWGGSMGGIAGLQAAERRPEIEVLVLDSVPATLEDAFQILVRPAMLQPFVRYVAEKEAGMAIRVVRPVDRIASVDGHPVLVIQGTADRMIPADSAEQLCQSAGEMCTRWAVSGAGHLEAYSSRPAAYEQRVIAFLDRTLLGSEANEARASPPRQELQAGPIRRPRVR
jgi:pimeloyl-ACP methyl ester carboxylesterase